MPPRARMEAMAMLSMELPAYSTNCETTNDDDFTPYISTAFSGARVITALLAARSQEA
jgi:hypothetical protein